MQQNRSLLVCFGRLDWNLLRGDVGVIVTGAISGLHWDYIRDREGLSGGLGFRDVGFEGLGIWA